MTALRLATWNLESLDFTPREPAAFERRLATLRPTLARLRADVLCLQEVNAQKRGRSPRRFDALDRLLADSPYAGYARAASSLPGSDAPADVHNLLILSRWPIVERRQIWHDLVPPWSWQPPRGEAGATRTEVRWERPLLYARIAVSGLPPLHVLNLHLRAPRPAHIAGLKRGARWPSSATWAEGLFLASQKRVGQALEARLFVERLFDVDTNALIAVCGDLNADQHELPTRLLAAATDEQDLPAPGGRGLVALEHKLPRARRYTALHAGRRLMLDHVLASARLAARCERVRVLNAGLQDDVAADRAAIAGSLHAPLVAAFAFDA